MDGLNSIDDDLTDFINQIANSNDSDSPPGSAQSSSDSNSVRQLELLETIETKAVLPPCQVCGGNSSGYHYGADTCEACKVFFYRSIQLHERYSCKNSRQLCFPNSRFLFACKFCRYKRCVDIGMSRSAIKVGRYSKARHRENKKRRADYDNLRKVVPYLPRHAYADNLLTQFTNTFSAILNMSWLSEFKKVYNEAQALIAGETVPKDVYMDVWEVTGVELDNRRQFLDVEENILSRAFLAILPYLRTLPGMDLLDEDSFRKHILGHYDQFSWIYFPTNCCKLKDNTLTYDCEGYEFGIRKENYIDLADEESFKEEIEFLERYQDIALTFEESLLIIGFSLVKPNRKYPHFGPIYNQLVLSFTRYLEREYGKHYEKRLYDIVNFLCHADQGRLSEIKWMNNNQTYVNHIYANNTILKILYHGGTVEEIENVTQSLKSLSFDI